MNPLWGVGVGAWKDVFVPEQFFIRCMMMTLGFAK